MEKIYFGKKKITISLIVIGATICGIVAGAFIALTHDLPPIRSLETYRPPAVTRIYSSDNVLLAELFTEKRVPVPLEKIPDELKSALIATEDRNFFKHSGVDIKGVVRAIIKDIWAGEFVEGASTITQQLAKTLFLTPQKTISRKIREALLAFHLERRYTKS
jgi:penicillin-binding protein 1A